MKHCVPPEVPLPKVHELVQLPTNLRTAIAGRMLRLLLPNRFLRHLPVSFVEELDNDLTLFEESGHGCQKWAPSAWLESAWGELHESVYFIGEEVSNHESREKYDAFWWADIIVELILHFGDNSGRQSGVERSCKAVFDLLHRHFNNMCECIASEIRRLFLIANSQAKLGVSMTPSMKPGQILGSYAILADDDYNSTSAASPIIRVVDDALVEIISRKPIDMYRLTPEQFEKLIAEILRGIGYAVQLTARTGDGGRDIIAISSQERRKFLVECKRYINKPVGISIVQRLAGVIIGEPATQGIVATTSYFSRDARNFLDRQEVKWRLNGRDFWGIVNWLAEYERARAKEIHSE